VNVSGSELVRNNSTHMQTAVSDFQHGTQGMAQPEPWAATIAFSWYEGRVIFVFLGEGQDSPKQVTLGSVNPLSLALWRSARLRFPTMQLVFYLGS